MLYGSIHTHFESQYDTGNDKKEMVANFIKSGAKKVAVTEHGVFSSYEDLKDIVAEMKADAEKNGDVPPDFDIIPGVEGYFGEKASHIILIAKDYEGYLSLCKIISESNKNIIKNKPIITLENLQDNVNKGHILCTSACIAGPFGRILGLEQSNLEEKIAELDADLTNSGYRELAAFVLKYEETKKRAKVIRPTKTEIAKATKTAKNLRNDSILEDINERVRKADELDSWLTEKAVEKSDADLALKKMKKAVYARKQSAFEKYSEELQNLKKDIANGTVEMEAYETLQDFLNIFGEENFYFEIQNHGLDKENVIYNNLISFAYRAGHPRFVASNDIHVGVRKDDPKYEDMLKRRNVIKYTRFNQYEEESLDDREYVIKTNDELKSELLKIVKPVEGPLVMISAEDIVDQAIGNIEGILQECSVEFPKNQNHYPKFCDDENAEFERKVREGIKIKFPNGYPKGREEEYEKRLEYELGVIKKMGYAGYHLIVADYLEYGRLLGYLPTKEEVEHAPMDIKELDAYITKRGYPRIGYSIGPGRGSGAGSIVCYAMGIVDIDPIPYELLFERFLNTERVSMPKQYWAFSVNAITQRCA